MVYRLCIWIHIDIYLNNINNLLVYLFIMYCYIISIFILCMYILRILLIITNIFLI